MKLAEALQTLNEAESRGGKVFSVLLACGFTPLHLGTLLGAHLQKALPERRVKVKSGLYGDIAGTLERTLPEDTHAVAVALEWPDLDTRLGYRNLGGWGTEQEIHIAGEVRVALERLREAVERLNATVPVVVSLPSLPLPPAFHTTSWQAGKAELEILSALSTFAVNLAAYPGVLVANPQRVLEESPCLQRLDLKTEILTGHPYSIAHANAVATALARLLQPTIPKKGLITDLDDTLWKGLVGEIGPEAVAWDLGSHAQIHGLYQQMLAGLVGQGVLLAAASKNDPDKVDEVFARRDMLLSKDNIFPTEIHWEPKSESVRRVLAAWNVSANDVVFVDDSPTELAEVKASWPEIECVLFPKDDYSAALVLFRKLRDSFGKSRVGDEDKLRLKSIRASAATPRENSRGSRQETFLSQARAIVTAQFNPPAGDPRIFELVNKTNQFNLNGLRHTQAEWRRTIESLNSFLVAVSYEDKYGPLGRIAVIAGERLDQALRVHTWVMSCRAFSRRIEHGCMELLFSYFGAKKIRFDCAATPKNEPFRKCFEPFLGAAPEGPFIMTRVQFEKHRPPLYYKVETIS